LVKATAMTISLRTAHFNNNDYHNNNITTAVHAASPEHEQRVNLSNLVMRFSTENYKNRLRKIVGLPK